MPCHNLLYTQNDAENNQWRFERDLIICRHLLYCSDRPHFLVCLLIYIYGIASLIFKYLLPKSALEKKRKKRALYINTHASKYHKRAHARQLHVGLIVLPWIHFNCSSCFFLSTSRLFTPHLNSYRRLFLSNHLLHLQPGLTWMRTHMHSSDCCGSW